MGPLYIMNRRKKIIYQIKVERKIQECIVVCFSIVVLFTYFFLFIVRKNYFETIYFIWKRFIVARIKLQQFFFRKNFPNIDK